MSCDFTKPLCFTTFVLLPPQSLIHSRDYAAKVKKPFPHIDENILEDKDWPEDCYVFHGKEEEPTIVYMPLFNRKNCKGALHSRSQERSGRACTGTYLHLFCIVLFTALELLIYSLENHYSITHLH